MLLAPVAVVVATQQNPVAVAVASNNSQSLIVWETEGHAVTAAVVEHGKVVVPPAKLVERKGEPDLLLAAWTGRAWAVAMCGDTDLTWGEVSADGHYTPRGAKTFDGRPVCEAMTARDGHAFVHVTVRDLEAHKCSSWRVELAAEPVLGTPRPLCHVWAEAGDVWFGADTKLQDAMSDAHGRVTRTAVTQESAVTGSTVVTHSQASIRLWTAPFKKPAKVVTLGEDVIDPYSPGQLFGRPDGVVLLQPGSGDQRIALVRFDAAGKVVDRFAFGGAHPLYRTCGEHACAWTDQKTGDVSAVELP